MKFVLMATAAMLAPVLASAQTVPAAAPAATAGVGAAVGATVYDTAGAVVGTVASVDGANAVIDTGTVKAAVPMTSLGKGAKGPVLGLTKVQLEAAAGQQQAQAGAEFQAKLVPGATVFGTGGTQLGTIKSVGGGNVVVTTPHGEASVPSNGFGPGPKGVTLGMTAEQLHGAMGGAAASAGTDATAPGTSSTTATSTTATDPASGATTTTTQSTTTGAAAPAAAATPADPAAATTTTTTETKKTTRRNRRPRS